MYKPTARDKAWTRRLWGHLKVGGIWAYATEPIAVRKDSEKKALILSFMPVYNEDIRKLSSVFNSLGIDVSYAGEMLD